MKCSLLFIFKYRATSCLPTTYTVSKLYHRGTLIFEHRLYTVKLKKSSLYTTYDSSGALSCLVCVSVCPFHIRLKYLLTEVHGNIHQLKTESIYIPEEMTV